MLSEQLVSKFQKELKNRFYQLREEISQELIKSDNQTHIELAGKVHDVEEESVANLLVDLNLASIDRHVNEIRDIDAALLRIANGTYGTCCDCSRVIDTERLNAYLTAKRCHECQVQYEKTHIQPGHANL